MEANETNTAIINWYHRSSKTTRVSLVLILICVVLGLVQWSNWQTQVQFCNVIDGCELSETDLQKMQLAFGKSGLNEFEVVEGQIRVPSEKKSQYLKALSDHEAEPQHLREGDDVAANINPFMSRSQQKLIERNRKKKQVKEMLARLPFINQVWFEMDTAESRTAFAPVLQTAVVSVQPELEQPLSSAEIDTIRQVIVGSLAGIERENIVVTDLNVGRAIREPLASSTIQVGHANNELQTPSNIDSQTKPTRKEYFESQVQSVLSSYQDLVIEVHYVSETQFPGDFEPGDRFAEMPNMLAPMQRQSQHDNIDEDTVGANGIASIKNDDFANSFSPSRISMARNMRPHVIERVAVSVGVPMSLVEERYGPTEPKKLFGFALEELPPNVLDQKFEKLKSELIEKVRPVLPVASFQGAESYPISVRLERPKVTLGQSNWEQAKVLAEKHWPTGAVLLVGFLMLAMVTRTKSPLPGRTDRDVVFESSPLMSGNHESDESKSEAEQQLSRLIEQDPDAAAKVLKSWIRKAA